jgi:hypothetical protein
VWGAVYVSQGLPSSRHQRTLEMHSTTNSAEANATSNSVIVHSIVEAMCDAHGTPDLVELANASLCCSLWRRAALIAMLKVVQIRSAERLTLLLRLPRGYLRYIR